MYSCMHMNMCVCIGRCMYIYIYIYICICVCAHGCIADVTQVTWHDTERLAWPLRKDDMHNAKSANIARMHICVHVYEHVLIQCFVCFRSGCYLSILVYVILCVPVHRHPPTPSLAFLLRYMYVCNTHTHTRTRTHTHIHTYIYIYIYIHIDICMYVYIYIYIYTYKRVSIAHVFKCAAESIA